MRLGRCEEAAAALAVKISAAIKNFNSAELCRIDVLSNPCDMWSKVRQLTGCSNTSTVPSRNSSISVDGLNDRYAAISSDSNYTPPCAKATANHWEQTNHSLNGDYLMFLTRYVRCRWAWTRLESCLVFKDWCTFPCHSADLRFDRHLLGSAFMFNLLLSPLI